MQEAEAEQRDGGSPAHGEFEVDTPVYEIGDEVVIAIRGVYHEATIIPSEAYWTERTIEKYARVRLPDGKKLSIPREQIVQKKQL